MPAAALVHAGMAWLLGSHKKLSNRTNPKHPKGFGKDRVVSVREKNAKHGMAAATAKTAPSAGNTPHTPRQNPCEAASPRCGLVGA